MRRLDRRWLVVPPLGAALLAAGPLDSDSAARVAWLVAGLVAVLTVAVLVVPRGAASPPRGVAARGGPDAPRVLHSIRLSRSSSLHVVSFDGRRLLVADGADGTRLIASGDAGDVAKGLRVSLPDSAATEREVSIPRPPRASAEGRARLERYRALSGGG